MKIINTILRISLTALFILGFILQMGLPQANPQPAKALEPYPDEITVEQAKDKKDAGAVLLDVREQREWNEAHIDGARLIPLGQLESRLSEVPRDKEIVVVCRSGGRSAAGRDVLKKAGFKQVTSMSGGMKAWMSEGNPVVTGP
jgi:rhodanese-related sulfurtransferase